jgi:hypothetical protein
MCGEEGEGAALPTLTMHHQPAVDALEHGEDETAEKKNLNYYFDTRRYRELSEEEAEEDAVPALVPGSGLELGKDVVEVEAGQKLPAANHRKCTKCYRPVKGHQQPGPGARCTAAPLLPSPERERGPGGAAQVKLVTPVKGDQRAEDDHKTNENIDWAAEVEGTGGKSLPKEGRLNQDTRRFRHLPALVVTLGLGSKVTEPADD